MNKPLKIILAILAALTILSLISNPLTPHIASLETIGKLKYIYEIGDKPIIIVKFKFPEELAGKVKVTKITQGWTHSFKDNYLIIKGGTLNPGESLIINYNLKEYVNPGNFTVTAIGVTSEGETIISKNTIIVREAIVLKLLSILSYYKVVLTALTILLFGGILLTGTKTAPLPQIPYIKKIEKIKRDIERKKDEKRRIEEELSKSKLNIGKLEEKLKALRKEHDEAIKNERKSHKEFDDKRKLAENTMKNIPEKNRKEKYKKTYNEILKGAIDPLQPLPFETLKKLREAWRKYQEDKNERIRLENEMKKIRDEIKNEKKNKSEKENSIKEIIGEIEQLEKELKRWEEKYIDHLWWNRDCEALKKIREDKIKDLNKLRKSREKEESEKTKEKMKTLREEIRKLNELYEDCIESRKCREGEKIFRDHELHYFYPRGKIIVKIGDTKKYLNVNELMDLEKARTLNIAERDVKLLKDYSNYLLTVKSLTDKLSWVIPTGGKIVKIPLKYFTSTLEYAGKASNILAGMLENYIAKLKFVEAVMEKEAYIIVPTKKVKVRETLICKRGRWRLEDISIIEVKDSSLKRFLTIDNRSINKIVKDGIKRTLNELQSNLEELKMIRENAEKLK